MSPSFSKIVQLHVENLRDLYMHMEVLTTVWFLWRL